MLVIIEGPDGSGKTTLIEKLRSDLDGFFWLMRPKGPPGNLENIHLLLNTIDSSLARTGCPRYMPLIMDRHPLISENIYGPVIRGFNPLEEAGWDKPAMAMGRLGCYRNPREILIVYCRPRATSIRSGAQVEDQMDGVLEKIDDLIEAYDKFMAEAEKSQTIRILPYDYHREEDYQFLLQEIQLLQRLSP